MFNIKVEVLAILLGEPIIKWRDHRDTKCHIAIVPLGGKYKNHIHKNRYQANKIKPYIT